MMKYLIVFLALLLNISMLTAQQRFEGSLLIGANLSQIDGDLLAGFNQPGFNAGMRVTILLDNDRWETSVGLQFSQNGSNQSLSDPVAAVLDKIRLNTIEVPVLVHFNEWKFKLSAGLMYTQLINYEIIDVGGNDLTDSIPLSDGSVSLVLGGGYFFNEKWGIEVLWNKSLNNLRADEGQGTFLMRNLSLRLAYLL